MLGITKCSGNINWGSKWELKCAMKNRIIIIILSYNQFLFFMLRSKNRFCPLNSMGLCHQYPSSYTIIELSENVTLLEIYPLSRGIDGTSLLTCIHGCSVRRTLVPRDGGNESSTRWVTEFRLNEKSSPQSIFKLHATISLSLSLSPDQPSAWVECRNRSILLPLPAAFFLKKDNSLADLVASCCDT